jgi:type IX secretion system PorP/SprF family membrane protein
MINRKRYIFFFTMILFLVNNLFAQNYHFSQYFSSPLSINPALTGYYDGSVRINATHRNQWSQDGKPFTTIAASAEARLLQQKIDGKLGIGLMFNSDKSNGDALSTNIGSFSIAYNLPLDADGNIELGGGLQTYFTQKKLNPFGLTFESQFGSNGFNSNIATPEMSKSFSSSYLSVSAGLLLNIHASESASLYIGAAMYNANNPKSNFLNIDFNEPARLNFQLGGSFDLFESSHLQLSSLYSFQQEASEIIFGGIGIFDFSESNSFQIGGLYRLNDAFIPYVGIGIGGLTAGISYDISGGNLKTVGILRNGTEFSLRFTREDMSERKRKMPWY